MELREQIEAYLVRTGEKKFSLAKRAGVNASTITRILQGSLSNLTIKTLAKIQKAMNGN